MIADHHEAIAYLDSLIGSGIRPGLDRMRSLLDVSGHSERSAPAVLIAGTNGKGSTAAILSAIVHEAGYRCGLYTSPHLVRLEERWRIGEEPVARAALTAAVGRLRETAEAADLSPTYFEALTILAFDLFQSSECVLSILEVGMGGRLDATNVVDPVLSVITGIDYDHQEWLGRSIEEIAGEKAGIARAGVPLVLAPQTEGVTEWIRSRSHAIGCELDAVSDQVRIDSFETGLDGSVLLLTTPMGHYELHSPLAGEHQGENVATAVRAAEILSSEFEALDHSAITRGVAHTVWRGRLEPFRLADRLVVVDGAHNAGGATRAAAFVRDFLPSPRVLVFGALADKDAGSMLAALRDLFQDIILTAPDSDRAIDPEELVSLTGDRARVQVIERDVTAIQSAIELPGASTVLICGSLYLAGTAVRLLDQIASPIP